MERAGNHNTGTNPLHREPLLEESAMTKPENNRKQRIIREDVKDRHTSHWDLDYVSREELEILMDRKADEGGNKPTPLRKNGKCTAEEVTAGHVGIPSDKPSD